MMEPLLLTLVIFSAQVLVVTGAAAIVEALGRVTDPRLRFPYWRGVALACLALPLSASILASDSSPAAVTLLVASAGGAESAALRALLPATSTVVWWLLCAGALARLGWLGTGAVRLRQLRQRSRPAVLAPDLEAIRSDVAPWAEVRVCGEVAQPAGFGFRHPIVLLPEGFFALDPEARRTVVCHELLHVSRRDWLWIVVEEVVRALFWFHPAIWWLVERIQESREQLVDRLVVARIPAKRAYMSALLAFADGGPPAAPATAFLRKRHLRRRLRELGKESVMSRRRLACTAAALMCVMGGATAGTVMALPLGWPIGEAAAHPRQVADPQEPGVRMPRVIREVKPQYTPEAMQAKIEGTLMMTTVVRTDGIPDDIEVTQSLDSEHGLDKQAVAALSQWRFEPGTKDSKPVAVRVTVEMRFTLRK